MNNLNGNLDPYLRDNTIIIVNLNKVPAGIPYVNFVLVRNLESLICIERNSCSLRTAFSKLGSLVAYSLNERIDFFLNAIILINNLNQSIN